MDGDGKGIHLQSSPTIVGYPIDTTNDHDDNVDVSGLSTILVATIQDAKDNISQIEYIFCSKIFPNFLSRFKNLERFNSQSRKTVEGEFKLKEDQYLAQIGKIRAELDRVIEENRELKVDNQRITMNSREFVYKGKRVEELEVELKRRDEEVDEGMRLQKNLLELVRSKERLLKESEEKMIGLVVKVKGLEEKVENLEDVVKRKSEKLASEAEMREKLNTSNGDLTIRIENCEKEKKRLQCMIDELEGDVASARRDLRFKKEEVEEGQELQKKLRRHVELKDLEVLEYKKRRDECEEEKKLLQDKVNALEKKVSEQIREARNDNEKLYEQLELKNHELQSEKNKKRELLDAYKRLKSQYKCLCAKSGLQTENMIHQNRPAVNNLYRHDFSPVPIPVTIAGSTNPDAATVGCYVNKETNEVVEGDSGTKTKVCLSSFVGTKCDINSSLLPVSEQLRHASCEDKSPIKNLGARDSYIAKKENLENEKGETNSPRSFTIDPNCINNAKYPSVSGTKRPAAYSWRDTRARHSRGGSDPHDDFLDTPLENVRGNLNKVPKENPHDIPITMEKDMDAGSSDDETQELVAKPSPQQQQGQVSLAGQRSFKYIEPVRKKAERENLKGVECKQCKKFYDAVLPDKAGTGSDSDSNKRGFRCEHLDGVSRHRYRYIPPSTPEGFWNIGFESEM